MTPADSSPSSEGASGSFADELRSLYETRQRAEHDIAAAHATRREALAEADRIVADAQEAAARHQAEAAGRASLARAEARGRAEQIIAEAEETARVLVADAEREAEPLRSEAETTRARAEEIEAAAVALVADAEREAEAEREAARRETAELRAASLTGILARTDDQLSRLDAVAHGLGAALGTASGRLADERLTGRRG